MNSNPTLKTKLIISAEALAFDSLNKNSIFTYEFEPYLKDSNVYGTVYFSRYFDWQGVLREAWFSKDIFPNVFDIPFQFVTKEAYIQYMKPAYPFQKIIGTLQISKLSRVSFTLRMNFYELHTKELLSSGYQVVVFVDKEGKFFKIPQEFLFKLEKYRV